MRATQVIDKKKLLVVFIPGLFFFSVLLFFIYKNNRCENLLIKNQGIVKKAYSYSSKEHLLGNGTRAVSTGFYLEYNGRKYKITTKKFAKPIPNGTPIVIRFVSESPGCNEIVWDSVFVHNEFKYEFLNNEGKGYYLKLSKVQ